MGRLLPSEILPFLLLAVLVGAAALVLRSVRRRRAFLKASSDAEMPDLVTELRLTGTLRRLFRETAEGLPLAELGIGRHRLIFCPTDHDANAQRYRERLGKSAEVALYGLASLEPGGVEAMREQVRNADSLSPETVALVHEGQLPNDYVAIGRVLSARDDRWGEMALTVYRLQIVRTDDMTLVLEVAVPKTEGAAPLPEKTLAHGPVRLFGYLA